MEIGSTCTKSVNVLELKVNFLVEVSHFLLDDNLLRNVLTRGTSWNFSAQQEGTDLYNYNLISRIKHKLKFSQHSIIS
jgi:hypothetical protein